MDKLAEYLEDIYTAAFNDEFEKCAARIKGFIDPKKLAQKPRSVIQELIESSGIGPGKKITSSQVRAGMADDIQKVYQTHRGKRNPTLAGRMDINTQKYIKGKE